MKKVLLIMAAALMTMTQCRKQETVPATPSANTIKMTITAGPGAKTNITDEGRITWTSGDVLYVSDGTNWLGSLTLVGEGGSASGTFTGDVTIGAGTNYHFFYLGHDNGMTPPTKNTATEVSISFASQDGSKGDAFKYHLGHGKAVVTVIDGVATGAVSMRTEIAIAHLNFTTDGTSAYTGSVTMDVSNTMTVSPAGTFSGSGNGITIGNGDGESGRYVTLIPTGTESVEVSFSGSATGSLTFGHGIQANNLYGMASGIEVTLAAHETVNFGNPNLNWSKYNLGVDPAKLTNAWDWYGDYYAWGEVVPYYTSLTWTSATTCTVNGWNTTATLGGGGTVDASKGYAWQSYSHGSSSFNEWNVSPCTGSVPYDSYKKLLPARDAATQAWGEGWRMPTKEEWKSLYDNNTFEWIAANATSTIVEGFKAVAAGYLVIKGKDSSLDPDVYMFLPAAGRRYGTAMSDAGSYGRYWSSSLYSSYPSYAFNMYFSSGDVTPQNDYRRDRGFTVRPVRAAR